VAAAILCLALPQRSLAADPGPQRVEFFLPGAKFVLTLPAGYCSPVGDYEAKTRIIAAADTTNLTDVSFIGCADMSAGTLTTWGMLKTPMSAVNSTDARLQDLIDYFKPQINTDAMRAINDAASAEGSKRLQEIFGSGKTVSLDMKPLAYDVHGIYFGGTVSVNDGSQPSSLLTCVYAITVVKGRVFMLYLYTPYHDERDVVALMSAVEGSTAAFQDANAN
jgi:hypothetical protein